MEYFCDFPPSNQCGNYTFLSIFGDALWMAVHAEKVTMWRLSVLVAASGFLKMWIQWIWFMLSYRIMWHCEETNEGGGEGDYVHVSGLCKWPSKSNYLSHWHSRLEDCLSDISYISTRVYLFTTFCAATATAGVLFSFGRMHISFSIVHLICFASAIFVISFVWMLYLINCMVFAVK